MPEAPVPHDGPRHREHLVVPPSWWLLTLGFAFTLVVAVGAYLNLQFGAAVAVLCLLAIGIAFWAYGHTLLAADDRGIRVDHSLVEWPWISSVEVLDRSQVHDAMGPGSVATAWFVTRPYVKEAVKVVLDDPADPHPFWLVSSRHPERIAAVAAQHLTRTAPTTQEP
ncbi:hypothetical protein EDD41_0378 [Luteococcus japonicus]|uniref:DUF3093 domain-containing protein n=2 Tax=Luteococcus japonicus TaxID=33984 RepID=A0A1R4K5N5_9ACTN|nr:MULTISPECIES: DUF3093 domain-containing protein [Luteococcus]MDN5563452.1 DUF3093 domain-containing protein [Luteococcus sp.]ROR53246.1 hypothetical protein EDD41_0378 [Luteococcus japonicus]SJN39627.1 hypothetical protein FM114_11645 [Luteococcus japonicus LSP_Lj1]